MPSIRWTREQALEMSARSAQLRRERMLEPQSFAPPIPPGDPAPPQSYALEALSRVRAHLDRIDGLLNIARDPIKVERLARARLALCEQEFALAGRPKPGQRRPGPAPEPGQVPARPPAPVPRPRPRSPTAGQVPDRSSPPPAPPNTTPPPAARPPAAPPSSHPTPDDSEPLESAPID